MNIIRHKWDWIFKRYICTYVRTRTYKRTSLATISWVSAILIRITVLVAHFRATQTNNKNENEIIFYAFVWIALLSLFLFDLNAGHCTVPMVKKRIRGTHFLWLMTQQMICVLRFKSAFKCLNPGTHAMLLYILLTFSILSN